MIFDNSGSNLVVGLLVLIALFAGQILLCRKNGRRLGLILPGVVLAFSLVAAVYSILMGHMDAAIINFLLYNAITLVFLGIRYLYR